MKIYRQAYFAEKVEDKVWNIYWDCECGEPELCCSYKRGTISFHPEIHTITHAVSNIMAIFDLIKTVGIIESHSYFKE